jgi:hypothetical protein
VSRRDVLASGTASPKRRARLEWLKCRKSFAYFADTYCLILAGEDEDVFAEWVRFRLWPRQREAAAVLQHSRLVVILKARQVGLTWLAVAFVLWLAVFHPVSVGLLFSRRDVEAVKLLGRLRGMYARLPHWCRSRGGLPADSGHDWQLPTGSEVMAFPTTAGDSYTAGVVLADEFDLVREQNALLAAVKPTVAAGGRMVLLSRPDKSKPESAFKRIYRAARQGQNGWTPLFLDWRARPGRDEAWYAEQAREILARTGSLDELHEQYPASEAEALSPRTLDKRMSAAWLEACYEPRVPLPRPPAGAPAVPGLEVYALPVPGRRYVVGADPAEGNPNSDDSALSVLDVRTGEEVCCLAGKIQPEALADYAVAVAVWYNRAAVLVERNNHGHATLARLRLRGQVARLCGLDGREGWLSSTLGNATLYDRCAEAVRNGEVVIHSLATFSQLASIDGNTLAAPPGQKDDRADAFALANAGRAQALRPPPGPQPDEGRTVAESLGPNVWLT